MTNTMKLVISHHSWNSAFQSDVEINILTSLFVILIEIKIKKGNQWKGVNTTALSHQLCLGTWFNLLIRYMESPSGQSKLAISSGSIFSIENIVWLWGNCLNIEKMDLLRFWMDK